LTERGLSWITSPSGNGSLAFLRLHPSEAMALLQDLLISVTNFFRDQEAFQAVQSEIPKLFADKTPDDQVRVWVPGCATGEEAYSIAIVLSEYASKLNAPPQIQVLLPIWTKDRLM
jgi:two-component system, chemotaxis family, CheB/CheR fusion protein